MYTRRSTQGSYPRWRASLVSTSSGTEGDPVAAERKTVCGILERGVPIFHALAYVGPQRRRLVSRGAGQRLRFRAR